MIPYLSSDPLIISFLFSPTCECLDLSNVVMPFPYLALYLTVIVLYYFIASCSVYYSIFISLSLLFNVFVVSHSIACAL